jgi:hypothetical protein
MLLCFAHSIQEHFTSRLHFKDNEVQRFQNLEPENSKIQNNSISKFKYR